ncbi:helix-turn-helix transcriptional regulator [Actinomycetospora endophytica]|uniref:Helix-turn-helix transcriptional regulator n=1 Tax=Actinomycetospora endophytica TaxID=2291215 RepID=A0ABS8PC83_9PSEU|nr:helix-turn-helix transcriptional regulator [Actinomycetospora endophytica]MCD2195867.1 helix-turn-helix transcriptional regulator [Actinomycetospora endophytica]
MAASPNIALRDFLRSRRARLSPDSAGIESSPGTRRVAGLRREEVARLAGVSVDYYIRLERGRTASVSASVLDAVARALQLGELERDHLFALAHPARTCPARSSGQQVRPGLQLVLDSLTEVPALVLGRGLDVLAANPLARALYVDFDSLPPRSRNMARLVFLDPTVRELYTDWPGAARGIVASLHLEAGRHPQDPDLAALVGELSLQDPDFRRWWADHDVYRRTHGRKRYRHGLVGELELGYEAFSPADDPDKTLGISTVEPGSVSEQRLRLLAGWAHPLAVNPHAEP